jgi:hypothetical protein
MLEKFSGLLDDHVANPMLWLEQQGKMTSSSMPTVSDLTECPPKVPAEPAIDRATRPCADRATIVMTCEQCQIQQKAFSVRALEARTVSPVGGASSGAWLVREPLQRHRCSSEFSHQSRFLLAVPEFLHFSCVSCRRMRMLHDSIPSLLNVFFNHKPSLCCCWTSFAA